MSEEPGILLRLSDENGLTPALLARSIIERHYKKSDKSSKIFILYKKLFLENNFFFLEPAKLLVSTLLKNTALIDDRDLAFETYLVSFCIIQIKVSLHLM